MFWYIKCEIKTASRWQQVTVNKWVIAIEPNHFKRLIHSGTKRSHVAQRRKKKCRGYGAKTGNMLSKM